MGYELRRQVLDALGDGFSPAERFVLGELADWANDDTRVAYGADLLETIRRRVGFAGVKQVRNVFTKLAKKGIEVRVAVYTSVLTDSEMVAWRGHQTTYRIPEVAVLRAVGTPPADVAHSDAV